MKKRMIYSCLAAMVVGFSSCESFLEEHPIDQMPEGDAYANPELIYLNTVANLYTQIGAADGGNGLGGTDRGIYDMQTFTADEALLPIRGGDWEDGGLWKRFYSHTWDKSEGPFKGTWDYLYKVVALCNQSIDKLQELSDKYPENKYYAPYMAEVRALRAMYYWHLMDNFGNVPLVVSSKTQISDVKQVNRADLFAFIKTELQTTLPLLEKANSTKDGAYYGRITQPVALFILAKLAINTPVYSDNDWTDNAGVPNGSTDFELDGQQVICWDAAIAYCDAITALGYTLESNFASNFKKGNESSVENIFVIPMDAKLYTSRYMYIIRSLNYAHAKAYNIGGWNGASATKEAIATFRNSGNTDTRLKNTFYTGKVYGLDSKPVMDGDVVLEYRPDAVSVDVSGTTYEKTAGARFAKYEIDATGSSEGQLQSVDYVLFRYADIMLIKAEAQIRKSGAGAGDALINDVRARSNAAPVKMATLTNLLNERMIELAWEGVRRQDLIRFGAYIKPIADRPSSAPFRTVFPIPSDVIQLNTNLKQNPGYGE